MLTRRHIRVKVLQTLYARQQSADQDQTGQEKFLTQSLEQMQELQALLLLMIVAVREHAEKFAQRAQQKYFASDNERNPSVNFINNKLVDLIANHEVLAAFAKNKKLKNWQQDDEYVIILFNKLKDTPWYEDYLALEQPSYEQDRDFILRFYKEILAQDEKLYDYIEDKSLTWIDDFPWVNTAMVKVLNKLTPSRSNELFTLGVFKDQDDQQFGQKLLRSVIRHQDELQKVLQGKTPNWDQERIADLDLLMLHMGICEFLHFPSIPVRVTINEYLEIAKEYSTPKSSLFINGILDNIVKDLMANDQLNKNERGLR
jgi:N utilization substance protein B